MDHFMVCSFRLRFMKWLKSFVKAKQDKYTLVKIPNGEWVEIQGYALKYPFFFCRMNSFVNFFLPYVIKNLN